MSSHLLSSSSVSCPPKGRAIKSLSLALLGVLIALAVESTAQAQLTIENLLGSSVSEIGPKHNDVSEAIKRFTNRDVRGARELLEMAKKNVPDLPPVEVMFAKMYYLTNNGNAGRQVLEQAVNKHPGDPEAYLIFAQQALGAGRFTEAAFLFAKGKNASQSFQGNAKRKRGFDVASHGGLATIAERRQNWPEAKKQLEGLITLDPESIQAIQRLAIVQFRMDDVEGARKTFSRIAQLDKKKEFMPADIYMGQLFSGKGDKAEAAKYFGNASKVAGDNASARLAIANWLLKMPDDPKAQKRAQAQIEIALKKDPNRVEALYLRGALARVSKDTATAEKYLSKAHLLAPRSIKPVEQLALLYLGMEDPKKEQRGLAFAALANQIDPKSVSAKITYAWGLLKTGRRSDAYRLMGEARKLGNIGGDDGYYAALFLVEIGQGKDAIPALEQAVSRKGIVFHREDAKALLARLKK